MKEFNRIFKLVVTIGELLIECDAETLRVIDTMNIIANSFGIKEFDSFIITNGLFVTASCDDVVLAKNKQIRSHSSNLGKVEAINTLSRKIASKQVDLDEAEKILEEIKNQKIWPNYSTYFAAALGCGALTLLYGGSFIDCIVSAIISILINGLLRYTKSKKLNGVLENLIASMCITVLAIIFTYFNIGDNVDKIIIGSIMPLVPGILLTNGIRDITNNDYLSGIIRVLEAILIASSIAVGVGMIFKFI